MDSPIFPVSSPSSFIPNDINTDFLPDLQSTGIVDLLMSSGPEGVSAASSDNVNPIIASANRANNMRPDYNTANQATTFNYQENNLDRYKDSTYYGVNDYNPFAGRENEYRYGNMQTMGDMLSNAAAGAYRLGAQTFVDGWKGWGKMTDALTSWDSSKLVGDPEDLYKMNLEQKEIMNKYAIYDTAESEKTVFNRQLLGNMIQQSGFALGATAQFLSEELLTMGLSSTFSLTKLGITSGARLAKGAYKVGELTADAKKLGDIWKSEGLVSQIFNGAKKFVPLVDTADDVRKAGKAGASALQMASLGMGGIKRTLAEANMAFTEARMEAAGTYGDLYDKMYNEHLKRTGQSPVGGDLNRIKDLAQKGAEDNYYINSGVLAVMNRIQFDNLFTKFGTDRKVLKSMGQFGEQVTKVTGKIEGAETTRIYNAGITGAVGNAAAIAKDFGKKKAAWEITKSIGSGMSKWEVTEGIQELIQEGSNVAVQDYYYDLYSGKKASGADSFKEGVNSQMNDQGLKTFMMGALTGRLISPITGGISKGMEMLKTNSEQRENLKKDLDESIELINAFYSNPTKALSEHIANFNVQNKAAAQMESALDSRDEYFYNNAKDSSFAKMVSAAKKTDMLESMLDTIREYGNHLTPEQMKQAFPAIDPQENNIQSAKEYFNKIANDIEDFSKTWEELKDKYGDTIRPELYAEESEDFKLAAAGKKALDDSLEILATNRFKAARAIERATGVYNKVQQNGAVGNSSAAAFRIMGADVLLAKEIDLLTTELALAEMQENPDKTSRELTKNREAELEALLEWKKNWTPTGEIDKNALLNTPALKKAYVAYLTAKNKSSQINQPVAYTDIDASWTSFMDYIALNKDSQAHIDAFNTLANPVRFTKMVDKSKYAIVDTLDKMREEAIRDAEAAANATAETPEEAPITPETPADPAAPAPANPATPPTPPTAEQTDLVKEVEALNPAGVSAFSFEDFANKLTELFERIKDDSALVARLIERLGEVKEIVLRNSLIKMVTPKKAAGNTPAGYVPISASPSNRIGLQNIDKDEAFSGIVIKNDGSDASKEAMKALTSGNAEVNSRIKVTADRARIDANNAEVAALNIPNRQHMTFESAEQVTKLKRGQSIITVAKANDGYGIQIQTKDGLGNLYMAGVHNYVIVHPDNTTEAVTFSAAQKDFVQKNLTLDKVRISDEQYENLAAQYQKMEDFQTRVAEVLGEESKGDVTALFNEYFTLAPAGIVAQKNERLSEVIANNPNRLFPVSVVTQDGEIVARNLPVIANKEKNTWNFSFLTNDGEEVIDESGSRIFDVQGYLKSQFGIDVRTDFNFPYVWVARADSAKAKHFTAKISKDRGTEPVQYFKDFLTEFGKLREAIEAGVETNVFKYDGESFDGINKLMRHFNKEKYGFYGAGEWFADLSYSPNSKTNKWAIELRPKSKETRDALNSKQKQALNLYFDLAALDPKATDDQVKEHYANWINSLILKFNTLNEKMEKSGDNVLSGLQGTLTPSVLFFYDNAADEREYTLKLNNKQEGAAPAPMLTFDGTTMDGVINVTHNQTPVVTAKPKRSAPKAPVVTPGEAGSIDLSEYGEKDGQVTFQGRVLPRQSRTVKGVETKIPREKVIIMHLDNRLDKELQAVDFGDSKEMERVDMVLDIDERNGLSTLAISNGVENIPVVAYYQQFADRMSPAFKADLEGVIVQQNALQAKYQQAIDAVQNNVPTSAAPVVKATDTEISPVNPTNTFEVVDEPYNPDEDPFMLSDDAAFTRYTNGIYQAEAQWLKNNANLKAAGITLKDLATIIHNLKAEKQVLGYYKDKAVYASESMSAEGTIYHESFHALFRDILNSKDRAFYLAKATESLGAVSQESIDEFMRDRGYSNKTNQQVIALMAEEKLADGFKDYMLNKKEPAQSWFKRFVKLLERIVNFFKANSRTIDQLYQDFDLGVVQSERTEADNINDEGVFELSYGRPVLTLVPDGQGVLQIRKIMDKPLSLEVQKELVNKLTHIVSNDQVGAFNVKFEKAIAQLRAEYSIDALVAQSKVKDSAQAIRNKYQTMFNEAAFVLGASVPYELNEDLISNEQAKSLMTKEGENKTTLDLIKNEVKTKIGTLGLEAGWGSDDFQFADDDETRAEKEKGGEFDTIHMNPLAGISKEFRNLFSLIPYKEVDETLGVTINRMADGNMLFNAVIKVAADRPSEEILPALQEAIDALSEDGDAKSAPLQALAEFLQDQFGIRDLRDPAAKPGKNIFLYKQFMDTFFVTELPTYIVKLTTTEGASRSELFDASINGDIANRKEAIKFGYEREYKKIRTAEEQAAFQADFRDLQRFIKNDLLKFLDSEEINKREILNKYVNNLFDKLAAINIVLPKILLRRSMQAIYTNENKKVFKPQTKSVKELETDQSLIKQGAYLQEQFFTFLGNMNPLNAEYLFADTKSESTPLKDTDLAAVEGIGSILKKATRFIIKYDINAAIPVFQNAENANIWRYSRYTPPILIAQMVREKGVKAVMEMYPVLKPFFEDNPLFNGSAENELFLQNLEVSAFNGFRQELNYEDKNGVTFGNIDTKALLISNLATFMHRETISAKVKGTDGKNVNTTITTFKRSKTQEEATTTNFLLTGRYKVYHQNKDVNREFVKDITAMFQQEYNRIAREWASRSDKDVTRYNNYNNNVHPETGVPIEGDSYTLANGKTVKLRAYQFRQLGHFFGDPNMPEADRNVRSKMEAMLVQSAKDGVSFADAMKVSNEKMSVDMVLSNQIRKYMESTYQTYRAALVENEILTERTIERDIDGEKQKVTTVTSPFLSSYIREDFAKATLKDKTYQDMDDLARDHHYNIMMNKMMVNQVFDGDLALGIKSQTEYYKRNKADVISGNSLKTGHFRTAVVEEIQAYMNMDDLTENSTDDNNEEQSKQAVATADGQSYHVMNHRIRMMDSWGRVTPEIRAIMNAYKYRKLTNDEIKTLENGKVVLNTVKTATGGILEYYKLSEHLLSRVDVSYLNPTKGTQAEAEAALDLLYTKIETLEDALLENITNNEALEQEAQIEELYREVQTYWLPKRSREKLHNLLNSMEIDGIDQLFDTNASKKTTVVPVKLEKNGLTSLKASKSTTPGLFKFMQVETSGIKDRITDPSQSRQLISTYLNKLDADSTYKDMSLKDLANEYAKTMGDITSANAAKLNAMLFDANGELNINDLFKMMHRGLVMQNADSNTLKFFELKNGKPVHNVNMPAIKKLFTYYYFSMYNSSVFADDVAGRSDILVSSYGYDLLYDAQTERVIRTEEYEANPDAYTDTNRFKTRHLGMKSEVNKDGVMVHYVEVMIPKPLADSLELEALYLEKLNMFFSTRIPTEDKRSMVVSKVVDYIDSAYQNSIVVPQLVHVLAGSDLDVDKLYSHTFDFYTDYNGKPHVYGDYAGYQTESQGKFAEYIMNMSRDLALKDLVDEQLAVVSTDPVIPADFLKLKEELGITTMEFSKDDLVAKKEALELQIEALQERKKIDQMTHDTAYAAYQDSQKGQVETEKFNRARAQYIFTKERLDAKQAEIAVLRKDLKDMNNTLKLIALHQVLKLKGFPTTQAGLTAYINTKGNPTVPVLQNERLEQKMAMLMNDEVFRNFYINRQSDTAKFKEVAKSIGASIEDVVNENSIYSVMGDVVANELNSSNKDGIGITASFNKFLAFAQKNNIEIDDVIRTMDENGNVVSHYNFQDEEGILNIGGMLGMFADAAKEPIPSVINLNPTTSHNSNFLTGLGVDFRMALLMNKVTFIDEATKRINASTSNASLRTETKETFDDYLEPVMDEVITKLETEGRMSELFTKDENGDDVLKAFVFQRIDPNITAAKNKDASIADFGIQILSPEGEIMSEDIARYVVANTYLNVQSFQGDVLKLVTILNLIKAQEPDFSKLDAIIDNVKYFVNGKSKFGKGIGQKLVSSKEYGPLIKTLLEMDKNSKELLITRSSLFRSINQSMMSVFDTFKIKGKVQEQLSDQVVKFIIINKSKGEINKELAALKTKANPNPVAVQVLEEAAQLFTADYWINNNDALQNKLEYLYDNHKGNPFVEFLKMNERDGIDFIEASSRMKLDKDITENIITGYQALQKSLDPQTKAISRFLFYYLMVKDGLGYGSNTFIKYLNPDLKQFVDVSDMLGDFHDTIKKQEPMIARAKKAMRNVLESRMDPKKKLAERDKIITSLLNMFNQDFDKLFENTAKPGQVDWIDLMLRKVFTNAANQSYLRQAYPVKLITAEMKAAVKEIEDAGVFPDKKSLTTQNYFDAVGDAQVLTIDFSKAGKLGKDAESMIRRNTGVGLMIMEGEAIGQFPLVMNVNGVLMKLKTVDGKAAAKSIIFNTLAGDSSLKSSGVKAEYVQIAIEGSEKLNNFGFTNAEGAKIQAHVVSVQEKQAASKKTESSVSSWNEVIMAGGKVYDNKIGMRTIGGPVAAPAQTSVVGKGVEISSNAKGLAAALTNPTELAKSKGNLTESYPVTFRNETYKDAEAAYQALKSSATKDDGPNSTYNLMVAIIKAKLEQYPRLVSEITKQGGTAWILSSTHQPTKQNSVWETGGQNWFIKSLNEAYLSINPKTVTPQVAPNVSGAMLLSDIEIKDLYVAIFDERDEMKMSLPKFITYAKEFMSSLPSTVSKQDIIEQLKNCL